MIVIMKNKTAQEDVQALKAELESYGVAVDVSSGVDNVVLGCVGDVSLIDRDHIAINPHVDKVVRVTTPFKRASRDFHPGNTMVECCGQEIGGKKLAVIAGPCSVESEEQIITVAKAVKESGGTFLRGGAFKPRTSPYSFQGLELEGLELLKKARAATGLPIVTEIMSPKYIDVFEECVDIIQVGARNMQNFDLLKELGHTTKPILLKRGVSSTIEEWLMSAEYIMAGGNTNVILCERGIRTFETYTRNTLDISAVPAVKKLSHLPVIIDPSHAAGMNWMVAPLAMAAVAAGADGLIIEVHNDPEHAKSDGLQSLRPEEFDKLMGQVKALAEQVGREMN